MTSRGTTCSTAMGCRRWRPKAYAGRIPQPCTATTVTRTGIQRQTARMRWRCFNLGARRSICACNAVVIVVFVKLCTVVLFTLCIGWYIIHRNFTFVLWMSMDIPMLLGRIRCWSSYGDGRHMIRREPAAHVTQDTIPPTGLMFFHYLNHI